MKKNMIQKLCELSSIKIPKSTYFNLTINFSQVASIILLPHQTFFIQISRPIRNRWRHLIGWLYL